MNTSSFVVAIKRYYLLTKPGIVYANLFTAAAGFFLASKGAMHVLLFLNTLAGICLLIAGACVVNNYTDIVIDAKMDRTKSRALVIKSIPTAHALIFAAMLTLIGSFLLIHFVNSLTFLLGFTAVLDYVVLYAWGKRHTIHGTLIGTLAGALPPVAGYTAAANRLDVWSLLLFLFLVFWQMPHFYAIAIYRLKDYRAAKLPVLPAIKGLAATKKQMLFYSLLTMCTLFLFPLTRAAGITFFIGMGIPTSYWVLFIAKGFKVQESELWSKKVFLFSLIIIILFSVLIPLDSVLRYGLTIMW